MRHFITLSLDTDECMERVLTDFDALFDEDGKLTASESARTMAINSVLRDYGRVDVTGRQHA